MPILIAKRTHGDYGLTITDSNHNSFQMDIPEEQGGTGKGMRPMQTLLAALIACSHVDLVMVLKKQKQNITHTEVEVDGKRDESIVPSTWKEISITFKVRGEVDPHRAYRAVHLSMEKYCSVAETLRLAGASITYKVFVNDIQVNS